MKTKTVRPHGGPSSWKSRRDAGEPTSRPLPFFFLFLPRLSLLHLPLPYVDLLLSHTVRLRFHLSFSSFPLERRRRLGRPGLRPFRIIRSPFLFSCNVLLILSILPFLLFFSPSCSRDSFYKVASSAFNYESARNILSMSSFVSSFYFFLYTLFHPISRSLDKF